MSTNIILIGIIISIITIINNSITFNPLKFTCNNYILNTYVYIILSILLLFLTIFKLTDNNIQIADIFGGINSIIITITTFILIFALIILSPKMFLLKHFVWILWLILMGIFIYPLYLKNKGLFYQVGFLTISIVAILSIISFTFPHIITNSWWLPLFISLIVICISTIIESILRRYRYITNNSYNKILSYLIIFLFSFWVMYDTKQIITNSKKCGTTLVPDYINESMNIVLDMVNIFTSIHNIKE